MIDPTKFIPDSQTVWFINENGEIESGWIFHSNRTEGMYDVGGCRYPRYCTMPKEAIFYTCEDCALAYLESCGYQWSSLMTDATIDAYEFSMRSWRGKYGNSVKRAKKLVGIIDSLQDELHNYKEELFRCRERKDELEQRYKQEELRYEMRRINEGEYGR